MVVLEQTWIQLNNGGGGGSGGVTSWQPNWSNSRIQNFFPVQGYAGGNHLSPYSSPHWSRWWWRWWCKGNVSPNLWGDGGNGKRTTIAGPQYGVELPGPGGTGGYLVVVAAVENSALDLHHQVHQTAGPMAAVEKVKDGTGGSCLAGTDGGGGGGSWNGPVEGGKGIWSRSPSLSDSRT